MAGYCFKALFVREVQVLVMGVDNGAGVLTPKFAGLLQDWMSFFWPDHRLSCKITTRKKILYFFIRCMSCCCGLIRVFACVTK